MKPHALLLLAALALTVPTARSQTSAVPDRISYQGFLTDQTGTPLGNAAPENRELVFRVWNSASAADPANLVYAEKQVVTIAEGQFSVLLGAGANVTGEEAKGPGTVNLSSVFDNNQRFLGVTVAGGVAPTPVAPADPEISPRQQLVSSAFALRAKTAENVIDGGITTAALAGGSIDLSKMASQSVNSDTIVNGSISDLDLANGAVTAAKLAGGAVTAASLADGSVSSAKLAAGSVTAAKFASNVGVWSQSGANVFRTSGRVGIGTSAPDNPLHVYAGASGVLAQAESTMVLESNGSNWLHFKAPTANVSGILFGRPSNNGDGSLRYNNNTQAMTFYTGGNAQRMVITSDGKLGVGHSSPVARFHIKQPNSGGVADPTGGLWIGEDDSGTSWAMFYDTTNDNLGFRHDTKLANAMSISTSGNVGIGEPNPTRAALVVQGQATGNTIPVYSTYALGFASHANLNATNVPFSIYASSNIQTQGALYVSSDGRIKEVLERSNPTRDLNTLLGIEITDYRYRDPMAHSAGVQKKVIAQQVEKVFPQAVGKTTDVVPDVFKKATRDGEWIALETDLKAGERVRLIAEGADEIVEVLEVKDGKFRTAFTSEKDEVFVYGREVKDFRVVDYEAIAMLNVSATQELHKQMQAKEGRIAALEEELAELKAKDAARDAKLVAIETLLKSMAKPPVQTAAFHPSSN